MDTPLIEASGVTGQVAFDGQTVALHRKGFRARATVGKGTKSIPVQAITGVQWKPAGAMVNGFIQFTVPGGSERRSRSGRQTTDAVKDENSVVFTRKQSEAFEALRDAVQAAIAAPPTTAGTGPASVADELTKFAQLRDNGVISAEEFEAQKQRLLG